MHIEATMEEKLSTYGASGDYLEKLDGSLLTTMADEIDPAVQPLQVVLLPSLAFAGVQLAWGLQVLPGFCDR